MERCNSNKENSRTAMKKGCITNSFKVKKSLFNQTFRKQTEINESPMLISSPQKNETDAPFDESPFALFKVKKKKLSPKSCVDKLSVGGPINTTPNHKRSINEEFYEKEKRNQSNSLFSPSPSVVKLAVQKSILNPDLIGDFSMPCSLSTIQGRHPDLKTVTPETVAGILNGLHASSFTLVDCRYPYEYNGGHVKSALNIYNKDDIEKELFPQCIMSDKKNKRNILIFYCEFSSERGPSMLRFLRSKDRDLNKDSYPFLYYPELYVMEGGYKAFFTHFKELCDPQEYKMMLDRDYASDLAYYRAKCKSWSRRSKRLKKARSPLVF